MLRNTEDNWDGHQLTPANSLDNNLQLGAGGVLSVLVSNLDPTEQYSTVQFVYNVQCTSITCTMADLVQTLVLLSPVPSSQPYHQQNYGYKKIYHRRRQQARQTRSNIAANVEKQNAPIFFTHLSQTRIHWHCSVNCIAAQDELYRVFHSIWTQ